MIGSPPRTEPDLVTTLAPAPHTTPPERLATFEGRVLPDQTEPAWDQGLAFDVETLIGRRRILQGIGLGLLGVGLAACGTSGASAIASATSAATSAASSAASAATADCTVRIPEETAGPYPGDGSNGPDVLTQSGVVRNDIRSSFGTSTTVA